MMRRHFSARPAIQLEPPRAKNAAVLLGTAAQVLAARTNAQTPTGITWKRPWKIL